jgi:hypothetical protein
MTRKRTDFTFLSLITSINVLVASGFSIAGLASPSTLIPSTTAIADSTLIFAMYAAARTIPLALLVGWAVIKKHRQELFVLGVLAGAIQILDGFIGSYQHDWGKAIGAFTLAILQIIALNITLKKDNLG